MLKRTYDIINAGPQNRFMAEGRIVSNSGRRIQPQNLKRGKPPEGFFEALESDSLELFFASPLATLSESLRSFIQAAPGYQFIGADLASIEARVLAWLAGEEKVLTIFRGHGKIYEAAAADIYSVPLSEVTEEQRFIGKVAVLALGYQGGKKAFQKMASNYGLDVSEERADSIKERWRQAHPHIVRFWSDLEAAALQATRMPGSVYAAGAVGRQIRYRKSGSFLWCSLPSGRTLCYPYPEIQPVDTPWGEKKMSLTYMTVDSLTRKWDRQTVYGGLLAENVTQAASRDILAEAMVRLEEHGYPIALHVHDEIISERKKASGSIAEFVRLMTASPSWAQGLPIAAQGWASDRYAK